MNFWTKTCQNFSKSVAIMTLARVLSFCVQQGKVEVNYITIIIRILLKYSKTILESVLIISEWFEIYLDNEIVDFKFTKISMNLCLLRFETRLNNYKKFCTSTLSLFVGTFLIHIFQVELRCHTVLQYHLSKLSLLVVQVLNHLVEE